MKRLLISVFLIGIFGANALIAADELSPDLEAPYQPKATLFVPKEERSLSYPIKYVLFYQSIGLMALASLDEETTDFQAFSLDNFLDGFTEAPVRDGDGAFFNYLLHPLWGSETYLRARSQNFNWWESFLFSTASSVVWEYGMENFVEQPSRDDLLITSTFGSLLGEVRFRLKKHFLDSDTTMSKIMVVAVDPIQGLTEYVGNVLGKDWSEPAYRADGSKQDVVSLDLAPVVNARGDFGLELLYTYTF